MKAKILIPPLIIVSCIALMVWLVYPAYTNRVDGIAELRDKKDKEEKNLADAQQKSENVSRMIAQLESNKVDKDTVMTYIPEDINEEEIIDNLNFIANNEELSVVDLSVKPAEVVREELLTDVSGNPITEGAAGAPGENPDIANMENVSVKAKDYDVKYSVVGSYDKIKNVLDKIYKLERYNSIKTLNIAANETQVSGEKKAPSDNLKAEMVLNFNMVKKFSATVSMNNPIFSQASFDMKIAQDIRSKKSVDVLKMNIDQAGRANPFTP